MIRAFLPEKTGTLLLDPKLPFHVQSCVLQVSIAREFFAPVDRFVCDRRAKPVAGQFADSDSMSAAHRRQKCAVDFGDYLNASRTLLRRGTSVGTNVVSDRSFPKV